MPEESVAGDSREHRQNAKEVRFHSIRDAAGKTIGLFSLDLLAQMPQKTGRDGASKVTD